MSGKSHTPIQSALAFVLLALLGCGGGGITRLYDGPARPSTEVATVELPALAVSIDVDGTQFSDSTTVALLPGSHEVTVEVRVRYTEGVYLRRPDISDTYVSFAEGSGTKSVFCSIVFEVQAGGTYVIVIISRGLKTAEEQGPLGLQRSTRSEEEWDVGVLDTLSNNRVGEACSTWSTPIS